MSEVSKTCVVVSPWGWDVEHNDYQRCGKPVVGQRAGFPMCAECMDVFRPEAKP